MPPLDIIIPTWNNPDFLNPCVRSIVSSGVLNGLARLIIVNNGKQNVKRFVEQISNVLVLEPGENLGWERGLEYGLKHSEAPFVCFQNDDTFIPAANFNFYSRMLVSFRDKNVAAVGPATTTAAGWHSIFRQEPVLSPTEVSFLIFFTVMLRRADLDAVGGIDTSCPGGDDIDLSIRFRKAGKKLIVNPAAFLIHHGFKSGTRLRGDSDVKGGWNSQEMREDTNCWLIQKHGFRTFFETMAGIHTAPAEGASIDLEGETVAALVQGENVVELGCGFRKSVPQAIGVDRVEAGKDIPHVQGGSAVADIVADVSKPLPFDDFSQDTVIARHILEHCLDTVETLKNWNQVLRTGGRLIIAVPNEDTGLTIPMNPEHVHAFNPESLTNLTEALGFKHMETRDPGNGVSFVSCFEKVLHMAPVALKDLVAV